MKIVDAIKALIEADNNFRDRDIIEIVKYLLQDNICTSTKTIFKLEKMVKEEADFER